MTKKVFGLDTQPGIQRDGTMIDKNYYTEGRWVRFQRGRPRKMGGYREIVSNLAGPSRGIFIDPDDAFNTVYNGYSDGLQSVQISQAGIGSGVNDFTLTDFTPNANNLWQFDSMFDTQGTGAQLIVAHAGQNLNNINNTTNTPILGGVVNSTTMSKLGVFTETGSTNTTTTITLSSASLYVAAGQTVTDSAGDIPPDTTVVSVTGTSVVISNAATGTTASNTFTFDNNVEVSGGVVVLHPYVFAYGNNGLIKNSSAGNPNDWASADANEVNVAATKIVKGLPVRGGSNSPSGLFWALDSLIRVSYAPQTITVGSTSSTIYWRYDVISSQTSILSSQCAIEYDGIYYWIGVDRFLLYNGVVKEIPNNMNQNYFFDNLNYAQRQKVYANKVPRFGEIWWFFPSGDSEECNDAIIYNVRENAWYDVGTALGSRRSAGYFSQVFPYPVNASNEVTEVNALGNFTILDAGTGYTNGTYVNESLTGGTGTGATANITVAGGVVTSVQISSKGTGYTVGDFLSASLPAGSDFEIQIDSVQNYVSLFQHEIGTDAIIQNVPLAIESYFVTNNVGWVTGGPSQVSLASDNFWIRLERVEPDFLLSGEMELYIVGRPYAQSEDYTSGPYTFDANTNKIDMKEQRRELRLKFVSNVQGGNYQLGYTILNADIGDVRGY
jgi:hypothetical protein